jgi:hypothetical protein
MPRIQASIVLPYSLKLESGHYPADATGPELEVLELSRWFMRVSTTGPLPGEPRSGGLEPYSLESATLVSITEDVPYTQAPDEQRELNARLAERLLLLTNRLLRAYRAISRNPSITELSRAAASPFRFCVVSAEQGDLSWRPEFILGTTLPQAPAQATRAITERLRDLLVSGDEPDVADLFLLDAELAVHEGRFREAVLFCWSTIDSTFNRRYHRLVDAKLAGEWAEARSFFTGLDFGLRNKMSAALSLIAGRSLFREPRGLWPKLSASYNKRNGIIHRGENADENDSRLALEVARRIVEIMGEL